ncbi:MAG: hypothetical protein H6825_14225 [Planctomycetes bacterium]|nr:hypothetical protein [Planctomycetota bacterium]
MPRASGLVVLAVLLLAIVAFRTSSSQRADRMLVNEDRARHVVAALHRAARAELDAGRTQPALAALLPAAPGLQPLPDRGDGRSEYARDDVYVYGFARVPVKRDDGSEAPGYVLRAWPLRFGRTGDTEWHLDQDGVLWEGQNELGRSGFERAFPPPFPEPELAEESALWWRRRLPDED